jgi:hypothetical protein
MAPWEIFLNDDDNIIANPPISVREKQYPILLKEIYFKTLILLKVYILCNFLLDRSDERNNGRIGSKRKLLLRLDAAQYYCDVKVLYM